MQPGDAPSGDAVGIPESLVILEFLADIFPDAHLLPADPTLRARARLFYNGLERGLAKGIIVGFLFQEVPLQDLLAGLDDFQARLPPTGFAVGEWSIADAAALPVLLRLQLALKEGLGLRQPEVLKEAYATIFESPKYARLRRYIDNNLARPGVASSWDPVSSRGEICMSALLKPKYAGCDEGEVRTAYPDSPCEGSDCDEHAALVGSHSYCDKGTSRRSLV